MSLPGILFVDDEVDNLRVFDSFFKRFYDIHTAISAHEGNDLLKKEDISVVISDQRMPQITGVEFLKRVKEFYPDKIRIIVTGYSDMEAIIQAINEGEIYQYITKPWDNMELKLVIDKALERYQLASENKQLIEDLKTRNTELSSAYKEIQLLKARVDGENEYLRKEITEFHSANDPVGSCKKFQETLNKSRKVAPTDSSVLVLGETGTGKELIARQIHQYSKRAESSLVKINCSALPAPIIESELFGHEKGAFSGAVNKKIGLFEVAHQGTVFLDEIGELPIELQPKLLRFLQEGEFRRVGGTATMTSDVRVIAATNRDLKSGIREGTFREDLYYRLNVFPIRIPPLRERTEDIESLVSHFVEKFEAKLGVTIDKVPERTLESLRSYSWPGNVRELENVIERSMILSEGDELIIEHLHMDDGKASEEEGVSMDDMERNHIIRILRETNGKISGKGSASELLKLNPSTLRSRIKKLGIEI